MSGKFTLIILTALLTISTISCDPQSSNSNAPEKSAGNAPVAVGSPDDSFNLLEAKWREDADGNAVPDFVEAENGFDPAKDDCNPLTKCGAGANGDDLNARPRNTLLMLDSSGSMRSTAGGGKTKMAAAKTAISGFLSKAPEKERLGFLVYGHKGNNEESGKAESCAGIDILAAPGTIDKTDISRMMNEFEPTGWTPIGASLAKAREAFASAEKAENRIILVSDGLETCGGDPVSEARKLREQGFAVTIDVVGFGVTGSEAAELCKIAEAGGGTYTDAKTSSELEDYFKKQGEAFKQTLQDSNCFFDALRDAQGCDTKLTSAALFRINREVMDKKLQPYGATEAEYRAFEALKKRIRQLSDERRSSWEIIRQHAVELRKKGFEINQQTLDNYDKLKR